MARKLLLAVLFALLVPAHASAAWNVQISNTATTNVSSVTAAGVTTFTATGTPANLNESALDTAIQSDDVVVSTGSTGTENGDLAPIVSVAPLFFPDHKLDFEAAGDITISQPLTTGGDLVLNAGGNVVVSLPNNQLSAKTITASPGASGNNQLSGVISSTNDQTWTGHTFVSGHVNSSSGKVAFAGQVTLSFHTVVDSATQTLFESDVDAQFAGIDLTVSALGGVTFDDPVGSSVPPRNFLASDTDVTLGTSAGAITVTDQAQMQSLDATTAPAGGTEIDATTLTAGAVGLGSRTLTVNAGGQVTGVVSGTGSLVKAGAGKKLILSATNTFTGGSTVTGGTLQVDGSSPQVALQGGTLSGTGTFDGGGSVGGTISPGDSPGKLTTTSDLTLDSGSTLAIEIAGANADQLAVSAGSVDLGGSTLALSASGTIGIGQSFVIVDKQSAGAVTGTFNGLPEGSKLFSGGALFSITYKGGDGNDVVLTRENVPTGTALDVSPASSTQPAPVTLTATVTGTLPGSPVPSGQVTFKDGGTTLGTVDTVGGVATLTTTGLAPGDHTITADFAGAGFLPSTGSGRAHIEPASTSPTGQNPPPPTGASAPTVSIKGGSSKEGNPPKKKRGRKKAKRKSITFVVTLSQAPSSPLTVSFTTKDGTAKAGKDYVKNTGALTFKPGQTSLKVTVQIVPDLKAEPTETFTLVIGSASGTGTIKDDDKKRKRKR